MTKIDMMDKCTGKVIKTFDTLNNAAKFAKRAFSSVGQAIKRNGCSGGYKWKYHEYDKTDVWMNHPWLPIKLSVSGMIQYPSGRKTFGYDQNGYKRSSFGAVHRLIAQTFLPKIEIENLVVDHINDVKHDNRACNLRWCSTAENNQKEGLRQRNLRGVQRVDVA